MAESSDRKWEPVDLGDPQLNREINMLTAMLDGSSPIWWWLSFCDTDKPTGEQFLGVSIVAAANEGAAPIVAHQLGCNPGGQVAMFPIPDEHVPPPHLRERLLSRAELEAAGLA